MNCDNFIIPRLYQEHEMERRREEALSLLKEGSEVSTTIADSAYTRQADNVSTIADSAYTSRQADSAYSSHENSAYSSLGPVG